MSISPNAGKVQTVRGLIDPKDLGITLPHEHLLVDQSIYFAEPTDPEERALAYQRVSLANLHWVRYHPKDNKDNQRLLDEDAAVKEAERFKAHGGGTIVDMTNIGLGRNPRALVRISQATGLHIVMGAGYYIGVPDLESKSREQIAEEIIRDITEGVDDLSICSGVIGELGCSHPLKTAERKLLRAAAVAQQRTGAPMNVHPGRNENDPLEILEVLGEAGSDLTRVVISHMDRCGYLLETRLKLLEAGCFIEYDVFGWEGYYPAKTALADGQLPNMPNDVGRLREIKELIELGYIHQLLLSHDIGHKHQLVAYGGWGYAHLLREVVPLMPIYGITAKHIETLLRENPKRLLTLV